MKAIELIRKHRQLEFLITDLQASLNTLLDHIGDNAAGKLIANEIAALSAQMTELEESTITCIVGPPPPLSISDKLQEEPWPENRDCDECTVDDTSLQICGICKLTKEVTHESS
jgi:hypothetical protein